MRRAAYAILIVAFAAAAWANSYSAPFIFDDADSTLNNPTVQHGWHWRLVFSPPHGGATVSGRPLVNASLALNWTLAGPEVRGYHVFNLAGHVACGLLLSGLIARVLRRSAACRGAADVLAAAVALLWTVHPLQTESVTYIVQRAEMMMGLCYVLVLYAVAKQCDGMPRGRPATAGWGAVAVVACTCGMLCKEVMVSAPVMAFLLAGVLSGDNWGDVWRRRPALWVCLIATWVPLVVEVLANGQRGGTSGFAVGMGAVRYWCTQGPALVRYIELVFWPHPLVLDYGLQTEWLDHLEACLPAAAAALILAATSVWLLRRHRWQGWLAIWFFAILAPTSLVPGNRQTMAEHRLYLALAPFLALAISGSWYGLAQTRRRWTILITAVLVAAAADVALVHGRNRQYLDPESMWRVTLQQAPNNPYAHTNLGSVLYTKGNWDGAETEFKRAIEIDPTYAAAISNLGVLLQARGRPQEAIAAYRRAIALKPNSAEAWNNFGISLASLGRWQEAAEHYQKAIALNPVYPDALANLGIALRATGRLSQSEYWLRRSLSFFPSRPDVHFHLGATLAAEKRPLEAALEFTRALEGEPLNADFYLNRGLAYADAGRSQAARADYERALQLRPDFGDAEADLGALLISLREPARAVAFLRRAASAEPNAAEVHYDLAIAYTALGAFEQAIAEDQTALRLRPDLAVARQHLVQVQRMATRPVH